MDHNVGHGSVQRVTQTVGTLLLYEKALCIVVSTSLVLRSVFSKELTWMRNKVERRDSSGLELYGPRLELKVISGKAGLVGASEVTLRIIQDVQELLVLVVGCSAHSS